MKALSNVLMAASVLAFTACGDGGEGSSSSGQTDIPKDANDNGGEGNTGGDETVAPGEEEGTPAGGDGESLCTVTHMTSGDESRFRVQGPGDAAYDCIKCPGPADVVKLTYTGTGFTQSLEFDGSLTNSSGAASDELILEQVGNVCWSEDYDAAGDLPSASALTVDGHAATIEFDQGPDAAGPTGTLSYYRNGVLQFAIPVTEGAPLLPYPDDGVQLQ